MTDNDRTDKAAPDPWDIGFGVVMLLGGLTALFVWFPLDIRGAFIEAGISGKRQPGDAFFPVLLACGIVALSALHLVASLFRRGPVDDEDTAERGRLSPANLKFLVMFHAIVLAGMATMYWLGPLVVGLLNGLGAVDASYRQLVDTPPYKYIGYVVGGGTMTLALIGWAERGVSRRHIVTVALVILAVIFIFDGLLNNVQLPPNADY